MIVIDTDILSMFAKADMIDLLKSVLSTRAVMTPIIRLEISVPLEFGYEFPHRVISNIRIRGTEKMNIEHPSASQAKRCGQVGR